MIRQITRHTFTRFARHLSGNNARTFADGADDASLAPRPAVGLVMLV
jgi:hypothetical protein